MGTGKRRTCAKWRANFQSKSSGDFVYPDIWTLDFLSMKSKADFISYIPVKIETCKKWHKIGALFRRKKIKRYMSSPRSFFGALSDLGSWF